MSFFAPAIGHNETAELQDRLDKLGYFTAPAALKHHGNFTGGLFAHSYAVTMKLLGMTTRMSLHWERESSPIIVGMLHDLCKANDYVQKDVVVETMHYENFDCTDSSINITEPKWVWNDNQLITGHGDKSIMLASTVMPIPLTDEEMTCIRWHMGAFDDKENWGRFSAACRKYPNLIYVHAADMWASQVEGV